MSSPPSATSQGDPRRTALKLLYACLSEGKPLDQLLALDPGLEKLSPRDRAFARLMTMTVLRRLGQLDALIDGFTRLSPSMIEQRNILRLGAAQLLFLETPPHAAISTAVKLAETRRSSKHKKLINAVLARIGREGEKHLARQDAACLNTPDWLWNSWVAAYGEETARAIAEAHMSEPPLDLTVKENPEDWAEKLGAVILPTGSLRLPAGAGDPRKLANYDEGAWWVQDAAAALPVKLLGNVRGKRVFDLCAAPGGKTAQLAAAGAEVTALDISKTRLGLVTENLQRLGLSATLVAEDLLTWQPDEKADAILLHAPCSATGTLRRHPDIAWVKDQGEPEKLAALQEQLLGAALKLLKPGGTLVYAVCSLQPEEGPVQIERLLANRGDLLRAPIMPEELGGQSDFVTPEGDLRTLPCYWNENGAEKGGLDGFYAARLCLKG